MPKGQNENKQVNFLDIEKLKTCFKIINDIISGIKYWKLNFIWPTNLYLKSLEFVKSQLEEIIFWISRNV